MQQTNNQNNNTRPKISTIEWQVICKILKDGNLNFITKYNITEDYFYQFKDEFIFIKDHFNKYNNVPDDLTFTQQFQKRFEMDQLGIIDVTENENFLFDKFNEEYNYIKLLPKLNRINELLSTDSRQVVDYLKTTFGNWNTQKIENPGVDLLSREAIENRFQIHNEIKQDKGKFYITTGFKEIDDITGGLRMGEEFVLVVAKSGIGKTFFMLKMILSMWEEGRTIAIIEPEMSPIALGYRLDTYRTHLSNFKMNTGGDLGNAYEEYKNTSVVKSNKFWCPDLSETFDNNITVSKLRSYCINNHIDVLAIDGVKCLSDERRQSKDLRHNELMHIAEDLMKLSMDLKIPVITVQQLNRTGDRTSTSTDLDEIGESAGLAHNASKIFAIKRRDSAIQVEIIKNRGSITGSKIMYVVDYDKGTYMSTDYQDEKETIKRESIKSTRPNNYESPF